jgi:hypothetical protein
MNSNKHLFYCEMDSLKNPKKKIEHYEWSNYRLESNYICILKLMNRSSFFEG